MRGFFYDVNFLDLNLCQFLIDLVVVFATLIIDIKYIKIIIIKKDINIMNKKINFRIYHVPMFFWLASLFLISSFISSDAMAQGADLNIGTMLANFTDSGKALIKLVQASAFVIGVYLLISSVFKMIAVSNGKAEIKTPIVMFFCGIFLISLMSSFAVVSQTMGMPAGPGDVLMGAGTGGFKGMSAAAMTGILTFVQLLGFVAFVRGWLLLNTHGMGKEGALGRGLTHLLGGVAAINIKLTAKILATTFAPQALAYIS